MVKIIKIDEVFKTQEMSGIIEKIDNLNQFIIENPQCSFLPFMGIFRPHKETTKVRVFICLTYVKRQIKSNSILVIIMLYGLDQI